MSKIMNSDKYQALLILLEDRVKTWERLENMAATIGAAVKEDSAMENVVSLLDERETILEELKSIDNMVEEALAKGDSLDSSNHPEAALLIEETTSLCKSVMELDANALSKAKSVVDKILSELGGLSGGKKVAAGYGDGGGKKEMFGRYISKKL